MDRVLRAGVALAVAASGCRGTSVEMPQPPPRFEVVEATVAEIHTAMRAGQLTTRQLVEAYLARIEAYDREGPALNALIVVNPRALALADSLDGLHARNRRLVGPLHGIPVILKDNYDTADLPTTAGSAVLAGSVPPDDADQVRRLRAAGAIVLAKANMAEFAFSPHETVGSALAGPTRNPYALGRTPGGSSGGTAAAVAASFGAVGLGTDTGNSIRGPAAHTALVGIRPTMGLTSRDGIVPLYLDRDVGGPMARTVADAVAVLDVIAGMDPADSVTLEQRGRTPDRYEYFLLRDGLEDTRLGVVRAWTDVETADNEVTLRFAEALEDMRRLGATTIDPVTIPLLDSLPSLFCPRFRTDIEAYLAGLGEAAPVKTLDEIVESGDFHPSIEARLNTMQAFTSPAEDEGCRRVARDAARLRSAVLAVMQRHDLDALVYPTWSNPPRLLGDDSTAHGNNSFQLAPPTGFPAITVPMGYVGADLPVGIQLLGPAWSEPKLVAMAFAYEQATHHRVPPRTTPPIPPRLPVDPESRRLRN